MSAIMKGMMDAEAIIKDPNELKRATFEEAVQAKFKKYIGLTVDEIHAKVGKGLSQNAKGYLASLSRRMMGVNTKKIEEFEKAEITMRTLALEPSGVLKESISFPAFDYMDLLNEEWASSELRNALKNKFFFVVFRKNAKDKKNKNYFTLDKVLFWNLPEKELEGEVRKTWEKTRQRIKEGKADKLPGITEGLICHVRPHATKGDRLLQTPLNGMLKKHCFWLTSKYVKKQIEKDK